MKSWKVGMIVAGLAAAPALAQPMSEDFESYAAGSGINGQGPWEVWYTGGVDGTVSSDHAASGSNSLRLTEFSDIVHRYAVTSGRWAWGAKVYIPSDAGGSPRDMYLIVMNGYGLAGVDNWSVQVRFGLDDMTIASDFGGETTALTPDTWIDFRAEVDLGTGDLDIYVNGQILVENADWNSNAGTGGVREIASCDLYSAGIEGAYIDDVYLEELPAGCAADFNGDDFLDFFDYSDYVLCFEESTCPPGKTADFNGDDFVDFFDYSDYVTAFETGC